MKYDAYWRWNTDAQEIGWLEESHLRVLPKFFRQFCTQLSTIMGESALACARGIIQTDRKCEDSRVKFVNHFAVQVMQGDQYLALRRGLHRTCRRLRVDVEAAVVVVALFHHAQMFGVPQLAPPLHTGWQPMTAPDGAQYRVLHDTGAYRRHLEIVGSES
ncbi:MAG: hypothetical protein AAB384_02230 [Patescibacteria group bacterium]